MKLVGVILILTLIVLIIALRLILRIHYARNSTPQRSYKIPSNLSDGISIHGINFQHLDDTNLGPFQGNIIAQKDNPYDPYAIAVYSNNRLLGYLPAGNVQLHARLMQRDNRTMPCYGSIAKGNDHGRSYFYGRLKLLE